MGRLFWKIFLGFWLTLLLSNIGIAWVTAQFLMLTDTKPSQRLDSKSKHQIMAISSVLEYGGEPAAINMMQKERFDHTRFTIFVINEKGNDILGRTFINPNQQGITDINKSRAIKQQIQGISHKVISAEGKQFIIKSVPKPHNFFSVYKKLQHQRDFFPQPKHRKPPPSPLDKRELLFIRLGLMIPISGLICFWLAWYLTKPVRQLREATQRLADGELAVRVSPFMKNRQDEIADLGTDFDHMAEQLTLMINRQKQLIQDISHELRSPLARLQVAMGLARKKIGSEAAYELERIEREANRLECLVSQVLSLAKLEESKVYALEEYIDIADLLQTIAKDADYEAKSQQCQVTLECSIRPILKANGELLHRALENIIRNAVNYTAKDTIVDVTLQEHHQNSDMITIAVCDSGEGVPPEQLEELFEPFVRMAKSRNRETGGYGLGLAIAKRAIHLHGGQILANNREAGGLCVEVNLPLTESWKNTK